MRFDISVVHEAGWTRVAVRGDPSLGRLLSLLQVLEVDCASWPAPAALVDLAGLQTPLAPAEQSELAAAAARALRCKERVALLAPEAPAEGGDGAGSRAFHDEAAAVRWLRGA